MVGNTFDRSLQFCIVVFDGTTSVLTNLLVVGLFVGADSILELVVLSFIPCVRIAAVFIFGVLLVSNSLVFAFMGSLQCLMVKESRQRRRRHGTDGGCRVGLGRSPRNISAFVGFAVTMSTLALLLNTVFDE